MYVYIFKMCNNKELFLVGVLSLLEKSVSANIQESFLIRSARLSHACGRNYLPAANMPHALAKLTVPYSMPMARIPMSQI